MSQYLCVTAAHCGPSLKVGNQQNQQAEQQQQQQQVQAAPTVLLLMCAVVSELHSEPDLTPCSSVNYREGSG